MKQIPYDFAAHNFQKKFLRGFTEPITMINAPFIRYHKNCKINRVSVETDTAEVATAKYWNFQYISNVFKYFALKKVIKDVDFSNAIIFCYAIHTPFLKLVKRIKKRYPTAKIVQIVPDLPQFMNTTSASSTIYRLLKSIDLRSINANLKYVDYFAPFTEAMMTDYLGKFGKPYYVMEGVYEQRAVTPKKENTDGKKTVVYTGSLNTRYGIKNLLDAFSYNTNPLIELHICGDGELKEDLQRNQYPGVKYLGMLPYEAGMAVVDSGDILINPREANEVYTRYSFPSKIFDYLSSTNPILCFKLPGIPDEYDQYLSYFESNEPEAMMRQIERMLFEPGKVSDRAEFLKQKSAQHHILEIICRVRCDQET